MLAIRTVAESAHHCVNVEIFKADVLASTKPCNENRGSVSETVLDPEITLALLPFLTTKVAELVATEASERRSDIHILCYRWIKELLTSCGYTQKCAQ